MTAVALLMFLSFAAWAHCKNIWLSKWTGLRKIPLGNAQFLFRFGFPLPSHILLVLLSLPLDNILGRSLGFICHFQVLKHCCYQQLGNPDQSNGRLLLSHVLHSTFLFHCSHLTCTQNPGVRRGPVVCCDYTTSPVPRDATDTSTFRTRSRGEKGW